MKPLLLALVPLTEERWNLLSEEFEILYAPDPARRQAVFAERQGDATVRLVLTTGAAGVTAAEIDALPGLSFIGSVGVGYENIDVAHATARGIAVVNSPGINEACVADQAFALLLSAVRKVPAYDRATRAGKFRDDMPLLPNFSGKRLGIVGLGSIGRQIARRASGFDLEIGYHNRSKRPDVDFQYFDSVIALAQWADYLVIATPGGAGTFHMIGMTEMQALGSSGFLINIARGSVVDNAALAVALRDGVIAGAGLDVYESEPHAPTDLVPHVDNLVLSPHVAGLSPEAFRGTVMRYIANARLHLAGEPLLNPIGV